MSTKYFITLRPIVSRFFEIAILVVESILINLTESSCLIQSEFETKKKKRKNYLIHFRLKTLDSNIVYIISTDDSGFLSSPLLPARRCFWPNTGFIVLFLFEFKSFIFPFLNKKKFTTKNLFLHINLTRDDLCPYGF